MLDLFVCHKFCLVGSGAGEVGGFLGGGKPCQSALDNPFVAVRNPFGFYFNQSSHGGLGMASIADELDDSCALFTHCHRNTRS